MSTGLESSSRRVARLRFWEEHDHDSYTCPDCDRGLDRVDEFDVHHEDGDPFNNKLENLIALCHRCHMWRHHDGPTVKGLDVEEWQREFEALGGDPP